MNDKEKLREWLKKEIPEDYDKYDIQAIYDPGLSYDENKRIISEDIINITFYKDQLSSAEKDIKELRRASREKHKLDEAEFYRSKSQYFSNKPLKPIKSAIKEFDINGFDVETFSNKNEWLFGGFYDNKYHFFGSKIEMRQYLKNNAYKNSFVVATNLQFDFNSLYFGDDEFFDFKIIMRSGDYILAKNDDLVFIDTMNYSPYSVKSLGLMLKMHKMYKPSCLGKVPKTAKEWAYMRRYNRMDCLISKTFMEYFQKAINSLGGELKPTIAGCALNLFQRKYLKKAIYHERLMCKNLIYESYYGGRTEAFKRGKLDTAKDKPPYFLYDFASLYPFCMLNKYPLPSSAKWNTDYKNINAIINKYEGVTDCIIESTKKLYYPVLPYRSKTGKLLFCNGQWRGVFCNNELRYAINEHGYRIKKVYNSLIYTKTHDPFKNYVTDLYNKRLKYKAEGNEIMQYATKILLNALYGKFATKPFNNTEFINISSKPCPVGFMPFFNNNIAIKTSKLDADKPYIIPIYSSYTTAYGRILLHKALISLKGIYSDTDSIISLSKIDGGHNIGDLKIEKIINKGIIIKPKAYSLNDGIKFKGIHNISIDDFNNVLDGKAIKQVKFMKLKESLRQDMSPNEIKEFFKTNSLEDNKRAWPGRFNKSLLQDSKALFVFNNAKNKVLAAQDA